MGGWGWGGVFFFFFFQAEDGIRDWSVTGVQTCALPIFLHFEMAKQALTAGKHILLEKPVTLSVEEARELQALAKNSGAIAAIDFEFRYVPAWQRFSELLAEEFVGKRRLIKIDWMEIGRAHV